MYYKKRTKNKRIKDPLFFCYVIVHLSLNLFIINSYITY